MQQSSDDLVPVMVPKRHLTKVYAYIASLDTPEAPSTAGGSTDGATTAPPLHERPLSGNMPIEDPWYDDTFHQRNWDDSPPGIQAILRHLAERPGQKVTIVELADALRDGARRKVAGTLGAFGHRVSGRYDLSTWPFTARKNYTTGLWEYAMPEDIAEKVRHAGGF